MSSTCLDIELMQEPSDGLWKETRTDGQVS